MAESEAPSSPAAGGGGGGGGGGEAKKPTAKELRMLERAKAASDKAASDAAKAASSGVYGDLPMVQSREMSGRVWSRCVGLCGSRATARPRARAALRAPSSSAPAHAPRSSASTVP